MSSMSSTWSWSSCSMTRSSWPSPRSSRSHRSRLRPGERSARTAVPTTALWLSTNRCFPPGAPVCACHGRVIRDHYRPRPCPMREGRIKRGLVRTIETVRGSPGSGSSSSSGCAWPRWPQECSSRCCGSTLRSGPARSGPRTRTRNAGPPRQFMARSARRPATSLRPDRAPVSRRAHPGRRPRSSPEHDPSRCCSRVTCCLTAR